MKDLLSDYPLGVQYSIRTAIYAGNLIEAIKLYREASGCSLAAAKQAIDQITQDLWRANPYAFQKKPIQSKTGKFPGCLVTLVCLIGLISIPFSGEIQQWLQTGKALLARLNTTPSPGKELSSHTETIPTAPVQQARIPENSAITQPASEKPLPGHAEVMPPSPKPVIAQHTEAHGNPMNLALLYQKKLANPDYIQWKNQPGIPAGFQSFPEETAIKQARAQIARNLSLPGNQPVWFIPHSPYQEVTLDGVIDGDEWQSALKIKLNTPGQPDSTLFLQANDHWLFLAADVPGDTTSDGFDQFRFYFHIDIDPTIKNERIHVAPYARKLGGIRQTTVRWQGSPPKNDNERWKKYPISDWRIFQKAQGASSLNPHRQFEAKLNLEEAGLFVGVAFPAFFEIETDPLYEQGQFKHRRYLGKLGSQQKPVWLLIQ